MSKPDRPNIDKAGSKRVLYQVAAGVGTVALAVLSIVTLGKVRAR